MPAQRHRLFGAITNATVSYNSPESVLKALDPIFASLAGSVASEQPVSGAHLMRAVKGADLYLRSNPILGRYGNSDNGYRVQTDAVRARKWLDLAAAGVEHAMHHPEAHSIDGGDGKSAGSQIAASTAWAARLTDRATTCVVSTLRAAAQRSVNIPLRDVDVYLCDIGHGIASLLAAVAAGYRLGAQASTSAPLPLLQSQHHQQPERRLEMNDAVAINLCRMLERAIYCYGTLIIACRARGSLTTAVSVHKLGVRAIQGCLAATQLATYAKATSALAPHWQAIALSKQLLLPLEYSLRLVRSRQDRTKHDASRDGEVYVPARATPGPPFLASLAGLPPGPTPGLAPWTSYLSHLEATILDHLHASAWKTASISKGSSDGSFTIDVKAPSSLSAPSAHGLISVRRATTLLAMYRIAAVDAAEEAKRRKGGLHLASAQNALPLPLVGLLRPLSPFHDPDSLPFIKDRMRLVLRMAAVGDGHAPAGGRSHTQRSSRPDAAMVMAISRECAALVTTGTRSFLASGTEELLPRDQLVDAIGQLAAGRAGRGGSSRRDAEHSQPAQSRTHASTDGGGGAAVNEARASSIKPPGPTAPSTSTATAPPSVPEAINRCLAACKPVDVLVLRFIAGLARHITPPPSSVCHHNSSSHAGEMRLNGYAVDLNGDGDRSGSGSDDYYSSSDESGLSSGTDDDHHLWSTSDGSDDEGSTGRHSSRARPPRTLDDEDDSASSSAAAIGYSSWSTHGAACMLVSMSRRVNGSPAKNAAAAARRQALQTFITSSAHLQRMSIPQSALLDYCLLRAVDTLTAVDLMVTAVDAAAASRKRSSKAGTEASQTQTEQQHAAIRSTAAAKLNAITTLIDDAQVYVRGMPMVSVPDQGTEHAGAGDDVDEVNILALLGLVYRDAWRQQVSGMVATAAAPDATLDVDARRS